MVLLVNVKQDQQILKLIVKIERSLQEKQGGIVVRVSDLGLKFLRTNNFVLDSTFWVDYCKSTDLFVCLVALIFLFLSFIPYLSSQWPPKYLTSLFSPLLYVYGGKEENMCILRTSDKKALITFITQFTLAQKQGFRLGSRKQQSLCSLLVKKWPRKKRRKRRGKICKGHDDLVRFLFIKVNKAYPRVQNGGLIDCNRNEKQVDV